MTFPRQSLLVALAVVPSLLLAGCESSSTTTLTYIAIAPNPVRLAVGGTSQLAVTGTYSDSTRAPLTSGVTYTTSAATVATVSPSGLVEAKGSGSATVTAAASGQTATVTVTVVAGPLLSIVITPSPVRLAVGESSQLTLTGTYADGSQAPVTSGVTYATSAASVATVSTSGMVIAIGNGPATITATHVASGLIATAPVSVSTLVSIALFPLANSLVVGSTGQMTVTGTYSDSTTRNLTAESTFVSSNQGVATVGPSSGLVTAVLAGSATITATHTASGKVASATVSVTAGQVPVINAFTASPASITSGQSSTLTWSVTDATSLSINQGVGTVTGTSTSVSPTATTTYTLTATNAFGSATRDVNVTVIVPVPVISSFTASPSSIVSGGSAILSWSVTGATSLSIDQGVGPVTGTSTSVSPTATTTYTLTATNAGGSSTQTAMVTVTGGVPVISSFTASPSSIVSGGSAILSWSVTDATSLSIDQGVGPVTGTSTSVTPAATTTYTLTATNASGSSTRTATVTVTAANPGAVFLGDYAPGVLPLAGFDGSDTATNPVTIDPTVTNPITNNGNASLKIAGTGCGSYIGGYIASAAPTDLHTFNAISFWAKTDVPNTKINNFGFGNDNTTATNAFNVESHGPAAPFTGYALTTTFTKYYIPVPTPAALASVSGLFYFSGPCLAVGANVWVNDIQFETLTPDQLASNFGTVVNASTSAPATLNVAVGTPALIGNIGPNTVNYTSAAAYQVGWAYFTYTSSDAAVATVDANGMIVGHAAGTASITVAFGGTTLNTIAVTVTTPLAVPTTIAPTPSLPAASVISMYGITYPNVPVTTWSTDWSSCCNVLTNPFNIGTHGVLKYVLSHFAGVQYPALDATAMNYFHVDVWSPNPPGRFQIQIVNDAGGPAQIIGVFDATGIAAETWVSLDIPLSSFAPALTTRSGLNQLLFIALDGGGGTTSSVVYLDNIYFHQ